MDEVAERIRSLAEPVAARHDAELVELSVRRGPTSLIRVVVDREDGIDVDACARISDELSRLLDVEEPLDGRYTLEVGSPGLDRPLRTARDFRRAAKRYPVRIVLAGGSQIEGTVEEAGDDGVTLATSDGPETVRYDEIAKAKVLLPW